MGSRGTKPFAWVVLAAASIAGCAREVTPIDAGDGAAVVSEAGGDGASGRGSDAAVPCSGGRVRDGLRCSQIHDSCEVDYACGYLACDCGGDGFWHCEQASCDGGGS